MQTHEVSTHIHGFSWLDGTPNMETLNSQDLDQINVVRSFINTYVIAWKPK